MTPAISPTRPLGCTETFFAWAHAKFGAFTIAAAFRFAGPLNADQMLNSIAAIFASDQLLSSTIISPASFRPRFAHEPNVPPLVTIVARNHDDQWRETLTEYVNRPFDCKDDRCGPLCEAIILAGDRQHEIIFRIHHSVCDGRGLMILVDRILRHYECTINGTDDVPLTVFELSEPLCPKLSIRRRLLSTLRLIAANTVDLFRRKPQLTNVEKPTAQKCSGLTLISYLALTENETKRLIQTCRQRETTVNAAIAAASLQAAAHVAGVAHSSFPICIQSNLDLRSQFATSKKAQNIGVYSFWECTRHSSVLAQEFWQLAKDFRHALARTSQKYGVPPLGFCLFAKPFLSIAAKSQSTGRTSDLTLSNLGVAELQPTYAGLQLQELYFGTSQNGIGARIGVMAVTVNSRLCLTSLTLSSDTGYSSAAFLEELKRRLIHNSHRSNLP